MGRVGIQFAVLAGMLISTATHAVLPEADHDFLTILRNAGALESDSRETQAKKILTHAIQNILGASSLSSSQAETVTGSLRLLSAVFPEETKQLRIPEAYAQTLLGLVKSKKVPWPQARAVNELLAFFPSPDLTLKKRIAEELLYGAFDGPVLEYFGSEDYVRDVIRVKLSKPGLVEDVLNSSRKSHYPLSDGTYSTGPGAETIRDVLVPKIFSTLETKVPNPDALSVAAALSAAGSLREDDPKTTRLLAEYLSGKRSVASGSEKGVQGLAAQALSKIGPSDNQTLLMVRAIPETNARWTVPGLKSTPPVGKGNIYRSAAEKNPNGLLYLIKDFGSDDAQRVAAAHDFLAELVEEKGMAILSADQRKAIEESLKRDWVYSLISERHAAATEASIQGPKHSLPKLFFTELPDDISTNLKPLKGLLQQAHASRGSDLRILNPLFEQLALGEPPQKEQRPTSLEIGLLRDEINHLLLEEARLLKNPYLVQNIMAATQRYGIVDERMERYLLRIITSFGKTPTSIQNKVAAKIYEYLEWKGSKAPFTVEMTRTLSNLTPLVFGPRPYEVLITQKISDLETAKNIIAHAQTVDLSDIGARKLAIEALDSIKTKELEITSAIQAIFVKKAFSSRAEQLLMTAQTTAPELVRRYELRAVFDGELSPVMRPGCDSFGSRLTEMLGALGLKKEK